MKFAHLLIIISLLLKPALQAFSQEKGSLTGQVKVGEDPLVGANVSVARFTDKRPVSSSISDRNGRFVVRNLPLDDSLVVTISYVGYSSFSGLLFMKQKEFNMEPVVLQHAVDELDKVTIKAEKLVVIKRDTVEFRVSAIKAPPNSVAQDILRRVPGLTIDRNGKLSFNGRSINKILVDGKVFFEEDGAVALLNVPGNVIDKIQIATDSLSNEVSKSQVLNLKLKQGRKYFGNGSIAAGTDNRYEARVFGSNSGTTGNFSVFAGTNNINKYGLGNNDFSVVTPGSGKTLNSFFGIDGSINIGETNALSGNYQFNRPHTILESVRQRRQNILPASLLVTQSMLNTDNRGNNHRISMLFKESSKEPTPYSANMSLESSNLENISNNDVITRDENENVVNTSHNTYHSTGTKSNWTNGVEYSKLYKNWKIGGRLLYSQSRQELFDSNEGSTAFYKNNGIDSINNFAQQIQTVNRYDMIAASVNVLIKLNQKFSLAVTNESNLQWGRAIRITQNKDSLNVSKKVDSSFSNNLKSYKLTNTGNILLHYKNADWYVMSGITLLQTNLEQKDYSRLTTVRNSNINIAPLFTIIRTAGRCNYGLVYEADVSFPTLEQLQPVTDMSNPVFLYTGNPDLNRSINHNLMGRFSNDNVFASKPGRSKVSINNVSLGFGMIQDKIISTMTYDDYGRQYMSFRNVNGVHSLQGSIGLINYFRKGITTISAQLSPQANFLFDKTYIDGVLTDSRNQSLQTSFSLSYQRGEAINFSLTYTPVWTKIKYQQNRNLDQSYLLHNINLYAELFLFKRVKLTHIVTYSYNNQLPPGFDRRSLLWNIQGSYMCLKNKKGEVVFSGFDVLRQSRNLTRVAVANYIEDSQANNLQQYFMLGFKYNFDLIK